ncbi:uncharacterized protein LOC123264172 [Cotesia glomerata]|uniref:C2H2-type domain-containing protein n=1 Tax=Cotesia glomerata TaxID=32391 RepID=A0AAV7IQ01_COTGL|nr:uncharacterized protein LOC123264172 [Cotesia glomerata]KAH0554949.1 hypothetical protein KQX54_014085 [Cotesia glomerata]
MDFNSQKHKNYSKEVKKSVKAAFDDEEDIYQDVEMLEDEYEDVEMLDEEIEEIETESEKISEEIKKFKNSGIVKLKFRCNECRKWFGSISLLATHYMKHDTRISNVQIKYCNICRRVISRKWKYLYHMQLHLSSLKKATKIK